MIIFCLEDGTPLTGRLVTREFRKWNGTERTGLFYQNMEHLPEKSDRAVLENGMRNSSMNLV